MIRRSLLSIVPFCMLLLLAGSALAARQDVKSAPAVPAAPPAATNDVVVKVLGESITEKDVLDAINQILVQASRSQQVTPEQVQKKDTFFYKQAIDTLVDTILLKNEARANKMTVNKAKIDESMKSIKAQYPDEAKFQEALKAQGTTEDNLRSTMEINFLCQQMIEIITKDVPPATDADIQKFYNENPKYFVAPELVHAALIFMKVDKNANVDQKNEVRKKLETLRTNIENKSVTFADAAKSNSDDKTSAQKGGDLGMIPRGGLIKPLEDAVFGAPPQFAYAGARY